MDNFRTKLHMKIKKKLDDFVLLDFFQSKYIFLVLARYEDKVLKILKEKTLSWSINMYQTSKKTKRKG